MGIDDLVVRIYDFRVYLCAFGACVVFPIPGSQSCVKTLSHRIQLFAIQLTRTDRLSVQCSFPRAPSASAADDGGRAQLTYIERK